MADVVEINDIEALRSYHLAWTALHAETPRASFFQTLEWLTAYWRHAGEGQRLRVIVVRSAGRPIGILPLVERTEPSRVGPVRVLTYPLEDWGAWYGPIGPNQTATLTLAMKHLASTPREWDVFEPRWTNHDTVDRGRTLRAMQLAGLPASVTSRAAVSLIECQRLGTWDAYLATRSSKVRHELRRQRRKLESEHNVEHLRVRPEPLRDGDGDPHWELYDACVAISRKSWQADSTTGNTLCHPGVAPLLRDAHEQAARLGMVDLNLLLVDGKPAAYLYAYHCRGEVFGLRMGYDPAAPASAGAVLVGRFIEESFERGDTRIDFGAGDESFKRRLRTTTESSSRLTHVTPTAWGVRALRVARRFVAGGNAAS